MCLVAAYALFFVVRIGFAQSVAMNPNVVTTTSTPTDLQSQIQQKNQELTAINQALAAAKANLKSTENQKVTLQGQINGITGSINTLTLGIQADTVTAQQLQLQVQQLNSDQTDIAASIKLKESAIQAALQDMEKNDETNGNLLAVFLKNGTLADGVLEANTLVNLQSQLSTDIGSLKSLHDQYDQEIQAGTTKQQQIQTQQQDLQAKMSLVQDEKSQKQQLLAQTKDQESTFQKQLSTLQAEQQAINDQIEAIDSILRTKVNPSTLPALGAGVLAMPVQGDTQADITQGYGATAFAKSEYVHHWHNGLDFAASVGTPILAAEAGTVAAQGNEDLYCPHGAYGKFIVINHNNGLTTLYGHLSKILVTAGQAVTRGQLIAYSGRTGDVTGPHLHFTVFAQSTYYLTNSKSCGPLPQGGDLNPLGYLF